jgi:hypothetical protein
MAWTIHGSLRRTRLDCGRRRDRLQRRPGREREGKRTTRYIGLDAYGKNGLRAVRDDRDRSVDESGVPVIAGSLRRLPPARGMHAGATAAGATRRSLREILYAGIVAMDPRFRSATRARAGEVEAAWTGSFRRGRKGVAGDRVS